MVIVVEIEDRCAEKPFLGGWRNVVTGTEYHDARTQTCPRDPVYQGSNQDLAAGCGAGVTRTANVITQTHGNTDAKDTAVGASTSCCKYTSVSTERATQTSRLPDLRDKLVTPLAVTMVRTDATTSGSHYRKASLVFSSEIRPSRCQPAKLDTTEDKQRHFSRMENEAAGKIQKCYRAYRARMDIRALARLSRETRAQTPPEPEKVHHLRHCRTTQFEIVNASSPQKRSDFEMLENVLGRWRVYESARIDRSFFGTSKLAARTTVLLKEIELLRSIEAIKTRVHLERRQRRYLEHLDKLAQPEVWNFSSGKKIHVDTLRVQRARECRDFYSSLLHENVATNERIETLINLKSYTLGHTCKLALDLVSLIDQELELLSHAVDPSAIVPLRNRMKLALLRLSLNFCEPRNKIADKTTENSSRHDFKCFSKLCNRCGKFVKLDDFPKCTTPSGFVTCENCRNLQPGKEPKVVYEPYELMLRELRSREASFSGAGGGAQPATSRSPAFAVDPRVIYRLVNYVWHGKSGISECDDLFRLTLVRFRAEREWSPWNTLLLTKREAALHQAMTDPWQIYSPSLVKKFVVKNLQAKLRFDFLTKTKFSS